MRLERYRNAKYWRKRAEQFRSKADNAENPRTKETLRNAGKRYDELAKLAEQLRTVQDAAE